MRSGGDKFDRWIAASVILHGALFAFVVFSPKFLSGDVKPWGSDKARGDGGIKATMVESISGVALPAPPVVNEEAPANDNPGLGKTEVAPPPPPDVKAVEIPEPKAPRKAAPKAAPKPPKPAAAAEKKKHDDESPPSNVVPYGLGGRPSLSYGEFSTGAGSAGVGFGDTAFGDRYGWYVEAMTRKISQNWLKSLVDARVQRAPRVSLTFDIARDGTVSNVDVKQSSGVPSLDRSAQRAIVASSPFASLPGDYRGSGVSVNFYFEYTK